MTIVAFDDAMLERAAKAWWNFNGVPQWDAMAEKSKPDLRERAKASIIAALQLPEEAFEP